MIPNMMCSIWAHHLLSYSEHSLAVRQSEISDLLKKKGSGNHRVTAGATCVFYVSFKYPCTRSCLNLIVSVLNCRFDDTLIIYIHGYFPSSEATRFTNLLSSVFLMISLNFNFITGICYLNINNVNYKNRGIFLKDILEKLYSYVES